jgi:hypothetical protein
MSKQGMIGMDLAAREMLDVGATLTDEQWHLPSGAEGWSVKDVVAHAGCLMALLVAAVDGAAGPDMGIEELNEVQVAQKRGLDGAETMALRPERAGNGPGDLRVPAGRAAGFDHHTNGRPGNVSPSRDSGHVYLRYHHPLALRHREPARADRGQPEISRRTAARSRGVVAPRGNPADAAETPPGVCRTTASGPDRPGWNPGYHKLRWSGDNGDAQCRPGLRASGGNHLVNR